VDALFQQCGVIRTDTMEELFDVTRLLAQQPVPRGRRVAILTNAGGPGILAADACAARGLEVTSLSPATTAALRAFLPAAATVTNPVDMIATATPQQYEQAVEAVLRDDEVDSAVVIFISPSMTAGEDIARAVVRARAVDPAKPVLAVFMGSEPAAELLKPIPSFVFPEAAVAALARAARYGEWREAPAGAVPELPGVDLERARSPVSAVLARGGGWARPGEAAELLDAIGIPQARGIEAVTEAQAVDAAAAIGYPVALKAFGPEIVHKTELRAIELNVADEAAVRRVFGALRSALGNAMLGVLVQEMAGPGIEMLVGALDDPAFGPVVACGFGGTNAELFADTAFRIAPLTDLDAASMLKHLRCAPLLSGYRGVPASDAAALQDAVLRMSALVTAMPEIREIEINPLRVFASGVRALDVRARIERPVPRPASRRVEY
jgi:acyl-CoA synthetase (NDP forming)